MKDILILGLGNDIVADDRFGPAVIEALSGSSKIPERVEVMFVPLAGFGLLDFLNHRKAVLIVDAIITGKDKPGTLHFFQSELFVPTQHLCNSHQINLPTVIKLGKMLNYDMPEKIDILAAEAKDVETITELMTSEVEEAVAPAVNKIYEWIDKIIPEYLNENELAETG